MNASYYQKLLGHFCVNNANPLLLEPTKQNVGNIPTITYQMFMVRKLNNSLKLQIAEAAHEKRTTLAA